MQRIDYTDQVFEGYFPEIGTKESQFDGCTFKNCDLTAVSFFGCDFLNCSFLNCNLSMVKFANNGFDQVHFAHCKMMGVDFSPAKDFLFHIDFTDCILDYAGFMKKKNRKALFTSCSLKGTEFSGADLTESRFERCDLINAVFIETVLAGVDFSSSFNFNIDPEQNILKKAKFSPDGLIGLLHKYGIIVEQ
ncbi:MAG: pentapeptide repeat-containing protein [Pedobacter sp.]|nr:pentapeptide repeat-containing protein [Pedobacter sp.]MDQ8053602.1 pentapeptide repeat-containing protein [Pedobacter sp.]